MGAEKADGLGLGRPRGLLRGALASCSTERVPGGHSLPQQVVTRFRACYLTRSREHSAEAGTRTRGPKPTFGSRCPGDGRRQVRLCFRVRRHCHMVRMGDATTWQNQGAGHSAGRKDTRLSDDDLLARLKPEDRARLRIDQMLGECGWVVQDGKNTNVHAGRGVAIREFALAPGHGRVD